MMLCKQFILYVDHLHNIHVDQCILYVDHLHNTLITHVHTGRAGAPDVQHC